MTSSAAVGNLAALGETFAAARRVADAVLYEGYVLYPYRASSVKNQVRWQFGVLSPPSAVAADPSERSGMRAECVVEATPTTTVTVVLRCLQVRSRYVESADDEGRFRPVEALTVGDETWSAWDEAVEHEVVVGPMTLVDLVDAPCVQPVRLVAGRDIELVGEGRADPPSGRVVSSGRVVRRRWVVQGHVVVQARIVGADPALATLSVEVVNTTPYRPPRRVPDRRQQMLRQSLVGSHLLLGLVDGTFVSAVDPPDATAAAVDQCTSDGLYPVLIGGQHRAPVVLAAPIVLYDDPAIAPESPGDMFDATEIDEILALRVLTLTDDEKRQARRTDQRAAQVVDRCDAMSPATFGALHGTMRCIRRIEPPPSPADPVPWGDAELEADRSVTSAPWWDPETEAGIDPATDTTVVQGVTVGAGTKVVLRPGRRSDAQDIFLAGKRATVGAVLSDVDGGVHLAVVVDDDPAADLHEWYGRYRYFGPDEVELLGEDQ